MSLCLFGGTFDPIHLGHLIMAEAVLNEVETLDKIVFLPAANPPHKNIQDYSNFRDRFKMVKAAIADNQNFTVSAIENQMDGKSYSIKTIKHFRKKYKLDQQELFFLIGEDSLKDLTSWKQPHKILALSTVLVARRKETGASKKQNQFYNSVKFIDHVPYIDISSTMIRKTIAAGKSIKYLVPNCVQKYIYDNKLYC